MIKVLKRTPATINGRDCYELLVSDDDMGPYVACDLCAYRGWDGWIELRCDCVTAHGCTPDANTYFLAEQI